MFADKTAARPEAGRVVDVVSRLLADQHAIVATTDQSGVVTAWSTGATQCPGVGPVEAVGRPLSEVASFGLTHNDLSELLSKVQAGSTWRGESAVVLASGIRACFAVSAAPHISANGEPEVVVVACPRASGPDGSGRDAALLRALVKRSHEVTLLCSRDLVIRYASPSLEQVLGYPETEVVGTFGLQLVHPDDERVVLRQYETAMNAAGSEVDIEVRARHRDGTWRWVRMRIACVFDDPVVDGVVLRIRDVTRRREVDMARADDDQLHKTILETAHEGVWAVGLDGVTLFANAKMAELMGTTHEEMVDRPVWEFFDRAALGVVRHHLPFHEQGNDDRYELEVTNRSGERRWLLVTGSPLDDGQGQHVANLAMYTDITDRKRLEQELAQLSLYDSLTSLPNRGLFLDRLQQLQLDSEHTGDDIAILFCDVDQFKEINRARGHAVGDEVLAAIAQRLKDTVRKGDTVARFDGDEFVVLCPATDEVRARDLATELCAAIQRPIDLADDRVYVSASVGVAATPRTSRDDLLRAAAAARDHAQELGRSRVEVHDATARATIDGRLLMLVDLQADLDAEHLEMHYQPIVRLNDSTPVGVEALMRWNHLSQGAVSPTDFIPVAEAGGLMPRLGAWGLRRACEDAARHSRQTTDSWHLAVNVSTRQLADAGILDVIRQALHETAFPADRLLLEVTETAVVTDSTQAISTLNAIREMGVRVAIDDFGTGYSSLSYLRQFPVDMIKIDKSFIAGMTTDPDDMAVVASLVSLAAAVGVHAVAEGVETEEQADALRRLGCPLAQGFLWSPAVPAPILAATMVAITRRAYETPQTQDTDAGRARRNLHSPAADEAVVARIIALHQAGASLSTIAAALNADNLTTVRGLRWHRSSVARIIADRQFPGVAVLH